VQLHELPHEGETKAEAAVRPRGRAIRLPERLEHVGKKIGGYSLTRVLHHDVHRPASPLNRDVHPPALRGELDSVHDQIPDDLLEAIRCPHHRAEGVVERGDERDLLGTGGRPHRLQGGFDDSIEVRGLEVEAHPARDHAGEIEEILHEASLGRGASQDGAGGAGAEGLIAPRGLDHVGPAEDGVQGGPELVRHGGE
jgi:hypothetical protein